MTRQSVWVRTEPVPFQSHGFVVTLSFGADHAQVFTPAKAEAYAAAMLTAASYAEHDALVARQMSDPLTGIGTRPMAALVAALRDDRPPLDAEALDPLVVVPGVDVRRQPFLQVGTGGWSGVWHPRDARAHALDVLNAVRRADLDAGYRRALIAHVGLTHDRAQQIVVDLANYADGSTRH